MEIIVILGIMVVLIIIGVIFGRGKASDIAIDITQVHKGSTKKMGFYHPVKEIEEDEELEAEG